MPSKMEKTIDSATVAIKGRLAVLAGARSGIHRAGVFTAIVLAIWLLFVGLFYVRTRMQILQVGYAIAELEKENSKLKKRELELVIELASVQSHDSLAPQAREKAGLVFPSADKMVHVPIRKTH